MRTRSRQAFLAQNSKGRLSRDAGAIRRRLWKLPDEFPPESKSKFCGKRGIQVMRLWIKEVWDENA